MKVYLEVQPPTLGKAIHRVADALRRYAPLGATITGNPAEADLQIYHALDARTDPHRYVDNIAIIQYQYLYAAGANWWPLWEQAQATFSYLDLPSMVGRSVPRFHHVPLGYDPAVFHRADPVPGEYLVLATGYVSEMEYIRECYEAARRLGGKLAHVGHNFHWGEGYVHFEHVSDDAMRELYSKSRYVAAMRVVEGFELPALEALACGTHPIMLDLPCYRQWFETADVAWVDPDAAVTLQLVDILSTKPRSYAHALPYTWEAFAAKVWRAITE